MMTGSLTDDLPASPSSNLGTEDLNHQDDTQDLQLLTSTVDQVLRANKSHHSHHHHHDTSSTVADIRSDKPRRFPCRFCGKQFTLMNVLKVHERIHTGEKPYICEYCHKAFNQSGSLNRHKNTHRKGSRDLSSAEFEQTVKVRGASPPSQVASRSHHHHHSRHQEPTDQHHHGNGLQQPAAAGLGLQQLNLLNGANNNTLKKECPLLLPPALKMDPLLCEICGITASSEEELLSHRHNHLLQYSYLLNGGGSPANGFLFQNLPPGPLALLSPGLASLRAPPSPQQALSLITKAAGPPVHLQCEEDEVDGPLALVSTSRRSRSSTPDKRPNPTVPGKPETDGGHHRHHQKSSHGVRCRLCDQVFTDTATMLAHARLHETGGEGRRCLECNKVFGCPSALKIHYRKHTGERPYGCDFCGKAFSQNGTLRRHQATCRSIPSSAGSSVGGHVARSRRHSAATTPPTSTTDWPSGAGGRSDLMQARESPGSSVEEAGDWAMEDDPDQGFDPIDCSNQATDSWPRDDCDSDRKLTDSPSGLVGRRSQINNASRRSEVKSECLLSVGSSLLSQCELKDLMRYLTDSGKLYRCHHCQIFFLDSAMFQLHRGMHADSGAFSCAVCGFEADDKYRFSTHFLEHGHTLEAFDHVD